MINTFSLSFSTHMFEWFFLFCLVKRENKIDDDYLGGHIKQEHI